MGRYLYKRKKAVAIVVLFIYGTTYDDISRWEGRGVDHIFARGRVILYQCVSPNVPWDRCSLIATKIYFTIGFIMECSGTPFPFSHWTVSSPYRPQHLSLQDRSTLIISRITRASLLWVPLGPRERFIAPRTTHSGPGSDT